jgi:hypothetical protein
VDMIRAALDHESSPLAIDLKQVVLADREVIPGGLRIERNRAPKLPGLYP